MGFTLGHSYTRGSRPVAPHFSCPPAPRHPLHPYAGPRVQGPGKAWGQGGRGGRGAGVPRARQRAGICLLRMITQFACNSTVNVSWWAMLEHRPGHESIDSVVPDFGIRGYDPARHTPAAPSVHPNRVGTYPPPVAPYLARALLPCPGGARSDWKFGMDDAVQVPQGIREMVAAAPRRQTRTFRPVATAATGAFDRIEADTDVAELLERRRFEHIQQQTGKAAPASPLYRLRAHRPYWLAIIGLVSVLVLSIITDWCGLDWDPAKGPVPPVLLPSLLSARAEAA